MLRKEANPKKRLSNPFYTVKRITRMKETFISHNAVSLMLALLIREKQRKYRGSRVCRRPIRLRHHLTDLELRLRTLRFLDTLQVLARIPADFAVRQPDSAGIGFGESEIGIISGQMVSIYVITCWKSYSPLHILQMCRPFDANAKVSRTYVFVGNLLSTQTSN